MRTSLTHPLHIDAVAAPGGGLIGMAACPGKRHDGSRTSPWHRDLDVDLAAIRDWGGVAVVTLMPTEELEYYKVPGIGAAVTALGMEWHHLPIADIDVPRAPFEAAWARSGPMLHAHLDAGHRVLLHCLGGLGRTGTIAARLLAERGMDPAHAIAAIRAARPGTIETAAQEHYALAVDVPGTRPGQH